MILEVTCYISEGTSAAAHKCLIFVGLFLNAATVYRIFLLQKSIDTLAQQGESVVWTVAGNTVRSCSSASTLVYHWQLTAPYRSSFQP